MRFQSPIPLLLLAIMWSGCSDEILNKSDDARGGNTPDEEHSGVDSGVSDGMGGDGVPVEIVASVGIGPAKIGGTYGGLVEQVGPPDTAFEYFRVVFALWLDLGIEVVFSAQEDGTLSADSPIVSVGTKLLDGYSGEIIPGMTRAEAELLIGRCLDVVEGVHCYHPVGLYLGFDDAETIQTVAIHPAYTVRPQPPEMTLSEGSVP